tara:strand:+ start:212 stop:826 length:615 start_codon:yes stop_codon:yes gene_type:complete
MESLVIIGYSGHAYVVIDAIQPKIIKVLGYCDFQEKKENPFHLKYLGKESKLILENQNWFVGIGDNYIRKKLINKFYLSENLHSVFHQTSTISLSSKIGKGTFLAAQSIVNPLCEIGIGCIINTRAIVEHECQVSDFVHIAPGAVLAGNVTIGEASFIGANAVVKQGITIGKDVVIGAGSVIIKDVPDGVTIVGNPGRIIKTKK